MNQFETVDDAPGHWAYASSEPLIMNGFPSGPHAVLLKGFLRRISGTLKCNPCVAK